MHGDDMDMVLQGPGGQSVMLMSDACGRPTSTVRSGDSAMRPPRRWATSVAAGCFTFAVRPSAFGDVEDLPPPAPHGPYGSSLSVFDGLQGGDWRLWINDDANGDTGLHQRLERRS